MVLLLAGCGKYDRLDDGGFTNVTFQRDNKTSTIDAGIVIYANSTGYSTNLKISTDRSAASISLPNGVYTFYSFGYGVAPGETSIMSDHMCALTSNVVLDGKATTVPLNFGRDTCADTGFFSLASQVGSTSAGMRFFRPFSVSLCNNAVSNATMSAKVVGTNCFGAGTEAWAAVQGAKVILPIYSAVSGGNYQKLGVAFGSSCATGTELAAGLPLTTSFHVPWGVPGSTQKFPMEVEVYSDSSCTTLLNSYSFQNGIYEDIPSIGAFSDSSASALTLFLRQP